MIDARLIEIAQNPKQLLPEDLPLLQNIMQKYPYVQIFRALHLLGIHRYFPEDYQSYLSETAAFTTDKKILYQLINPPSKITEKISENSIGNINPTTTSRTSNFDVANRIEPQMVNRISEVWIDGEINRILFPGEEDFMEKIGERIDIEATKESGIIVTSKTDDTIVEQSKITEEKESNLDPIIQKVEEVSVSDAEINFHGMDNFLPDIVITSHKKEDNLGKIQQSTINRHEDEMQKLIAEVEAKMKANKKSSNTKSITLTASPISENPPITNEINDASDLHPQEIESTKELTNNNENQSEIKKKDSDLSVLNSNSGSNVPTFINTWKTWLQLGKTEADKDVPQHKVMVKQNAIDKFIETEPKISQLKENIPLTIKEKTTDISHLMTETLANIYFSQKLYSKAIAAFETLKNKYPEKSEFYTQKIAEIKEAKTNSK